MIWFTSDQHFNHANILKYEPETRPFASVAAMNEELVKNWNSHVDVNDIVYVLGDMFMGKNDTICPILDSLNGKIIYIRGNHDTKARIDILQQYGIEVKDIAYLSYKGLFFIMCHFPFDSPEFNKLVREDNSECVWLYGHIHSKAPHGYFNGTYHVGVDTNNLTPVSIEEIYFAVRKN